MKRDFGLGTAALLGLALMTACATQPPPAPQSGSLQAAAAAFNDRDYVLGVNDKLKVVVFNEPNLSGDLTISQTGVLSMPLIGPVQADGVTVAALERAIADKLRGGQFLVDPRVSLEVLTYRPFFIIGEVRNPNTYQYSPGMTVERAVATAQGYTYRANQQRVFIKHAGSNEWLTYPTAGTVIRPGDEIRVPERFF